jgi:hypothetical protein
MDIDAEYCAVYCRLDYLLLVVVCIDFAEVLLTNICSCIIEQQAKFRGRGARGKGKARPHGSHTQGSSDRTD